MGLGAQHRMSRISTGWIASPLKTIHFEDEDSEEFLDGTEECVEGSWTSGDKVETVPLDLQPAVDLEASSWSTVWPAGVASEGPMWPACMGAPLPDLAIQRFRSACMSFPAKVGLGWDKMHPRAIARFSDLVIAYFIRLMVLAESLGHWHGFIGVIMIVLIPKADGGRRPIGLFPSVICIWMRCRLDVAQAWVSEHDREYMYAGPSKGAEVASWRQSLLGEAAQSFHLNYVSTLLDLIKAFDCVPFDCLAECAGRVGYNLTLLRLSIASYLLARVLEVEECCSVLIWATRGLAAGSVMATIELRVLLIVVADRVASLSMYTRLTVYVDDATLETVCTRKQIINEHVKAVEAFTSGLQNLKLSFSEKKNVVCASSDSIAEGVVSSPDGITISVAKACDFFRLWSGCWGEKEYEAGKKKACWFHCPPLQVQDVEA